MSRETSEYHVSYHCKTQDGGHGFGSIIMYGVVSVTSEELKGWATYINDKNNFDGVVIISFNELDEVADD